MTQRNTEEFQPSSERMKWLTGQIMNIAITIHKALGPGLLESVYEKCFCYELTKRGISFIRQQVVDINYDNKKIDEGLKIDILIDDLIIIELKAHEAIVEQHEYQLINYLKATSIEVGLLLNFGKKPEIKRKIYDNDKKAWISAGITEAPSPST